MRPQAARIPVEVNVLLGRLFDAAAGLLGVRGVARFEGQPAMELEGLAAGHGPVAALAGGYRLQDDGRVLDFAPLLAALADCVDPPGGAALFHATLAAGLADWLTAAVDRQRMARIAIGGGCALNVVLMDALRHRLATAGCELYEARRAPPGDGGLALGQAWVARRQALGPEQSGAFVEPDRQDRDDHGQ